LLKSYLKKYNPIVFYILINKGKQMEEYYTGNVTGRMNFGKYIEVPYGEVAELEKYPGPDVVLLGTDKNEHNTYKGRKVLIERDSLFFPEEDYGIYGSTKYVFPDANTDISQFQPSLETLLTKVNIESKYSVIDERGEDSFVYAISTHDIDNGRVFFLRITKYEEKECEFKDWTGQPNRFAEWMETPYTKLALCFQANKRHHDIKESERYISHSADKYWISYLTYFLQENKADEIKELIKQNNHQTIKEDLGQALANPTYMEALCKRIEEMIEPHFKI